MLLPLPIWQHLPLHFKKAVVSNLDFRSRCRLRVCSSAEKGLFDSCSSRINFLGINLTQPHFNSPHFPETPAEIFIRDKETKFSKYFNIYEAVEQLLSIFSNDRVAVDTFHFHVCLFERNGNGFKFFNSFMNGLQTRNITIKVRRLELLTSFRDKYQFVNFVKYLDVDHIQSIKLYRAFKYYMDDIVTTDQWMNLKEFEFETRHKFNIDWITHLYKLRLKIERLSVEAISELIQSFMIRNPPNGSFFSVSTVLPIIDSRILLPEIIECFPSPGRNDSIDFKAITGSEIYRHFHSPLHTHKIPMANSNNVFIAVLSVSNFSGIVCNVDSFEKDLKLLIEKKKVFEK
ncbi:hypothetical protein CAEBREN_25188 [Caenorhabditis brenneri]|uniref:DUF38 domain-containing protein n=1 Tax=Caenorhabditis brenneri TaxID=135651 RepID=G0N9X2_CAEBE|nr:hypothetical protein CAEBREN_25188 [Caenorhabditis brenneri]